MMEDDKTSGITGQEVVLFKYNPFFLPRTLFFCCFVIVCLFFILTYLVCLSAYLPPPHSLHYSVKLSFCSCVTLVNLHRSLIIHFCRSLIPPPSCNFLLSFLPCYCIDTAVCFIKVSIL